MKVLKKPSGSRYGANGELVCRHRDLSCCPLCAAQPGVVEVYGVHYFVADPAERAELLKLVEGEE